MKSLISFLSFLFVVTVSLFGQTPATKKESFPLQSFDRVEASMGINVTLTEDKQEKLDIQIANGVSSDVFFEIKGKTLFIKMKNRIGQGVIVNAFVHYKTLVSLKASMGATIDNESILYADQLELSVSSDASMSLKVDVKSIYSSVSAGKIALQGDVEYQEVSANTGGKYLAVELESKQAVAKAGSGATVEIWVTEKVESKATFGGSITVTGDPKSNKWEEKMGGTVSPH